MIPTVRSVDRAVIRYDRDTWRCQGDWTLDGVEDFDTPSMLSLAGAVQRY
jgi:hypothetical protein